MKLATLICIAMLAGCGSREDAAKIANAWDTQLKANRESSGKDCRAAGGIPIWRRSDTADMVNCVFPPAR